jgi:superfamily I DNA and/or RNA helicase
VETANRFQGLERKVILSLHTLSGKRRLDAFSTEGGRMCVATSRHRVHCIVVGRDGIQDLLNEFSPDDARYLGQIEDPFYEDCRAHATFAGSLAQRNAIIRP